jgi:tetratricopeptide (TPR) repeat protein
LVWRGRLYILLRDKSKAHADFRKALELDPTDFDAHMFLGRSIAQESPQEAALHFQTLWEQHPDNNLVRSSLAFTRRALGQLDEARQLLDDILADNPNDVSALISRGYVAMDLLQYDEAEQLLRRAVRLAPDESQGYAALQACLRLEGKKAEAKHYHDRFEELEAERKRRREEIIQQMKATSKPVGAAAASRE